MTGGIGFSTDGSNAIKKNKDLRTARKSNSQNPYWGFKKKRERKKVNFSELMRWKKYRASEVRKRSAVILTILGLAALLMMTYL